MNEQDQGFNNGGQVPAYGNEKTSSQVIKDLQEELDILKRGFASSVERRLKLSEELKLARIENVKLKEILRGIVLSVKSAEEFLKGDQQ